MKLDDYPIFSRNKCSLKECSRDDHNPSDIQYMTESGLQAVNFDFVKREYANCLHHSEDHVASVDTVMQKDDHIVFIEFKNGTVQNRNISDKIRDSLLIFMDITGQHLSDMRRQAEFILVSNEKKNQSKNSIGKDLMKKGNQEFRLHGLGKYETLYFRRVHTYGQAEFDQYLKSLN